MGYARQVRVSKNLPPLSRCFCCSSAVGLLLVWPPQAGGRLECKGLKSDRFRALSRNAPVTASDRPLSWTLVSDHIIRSLVLRDFTAPARAGARCYGGRGKETNAGSFGVVADRSSYPRDLPGALLARPRVGSKKGSTKSGKSSPFSPCPVSTELYHGAPECPGGSSWSPEPSHQISTTRLSGICPGRLAADFKGCWFLSFDGKE
jgi:hypothetical protein